MTTKFQPIRFKQDFDATGTNVVPEGSKMANFPLKYHFKNGSEYGGTVIIGEVSPKNPSAGAPPDRLIVYITNGATDLNGRVFPGKAQLSIPFNVVELHDPATGWIPDETPKNVSAATRKSSISKIPTPVKALLGLAFILLVLKWKKII